MKTYQAMVKCNHTGRCGLIMCVHHKPHLPIQDPCVARGLCKTMEIYVRCSLIPMVAEEVKDES